MRTLAVNALRLIGQRTAMGRYLELMAHYWSRTDIPFDRVILFAPRPISMQGIELGTKTEIVFRPFQNRRCPLAFWEQVVLPVASRDAAVLFCPAYTAPLVSSNPLVVANHGIYESIPGEFSFWSRAKTIPLFRQSARRADRVIANSAQTRHDVVKYFGVNPTQIDVVHPAAREMFFEPKDPAAIARVVRETLGTNAPYLLFVGKLSKRRNVPNLIAAFAEVRRAARLPHRLLIIGPNVTDTPVEELARQQGAAEFVHYIPHKDQETLAYLYAGADAFVLPTSYEGISWTMLEAMASGTAVLTVDHPTVHEGSGMDARAAVCTVPTPCVSDLSGGLTQLLTNESLRRKYAATGQERARQFSWESAFRDTAAILDQVANAQDAQRGRRTAVKPTVTVRGN